MKLFASSVILSLVYGSTVSQVPNNLPDCVDQKSVSLCGGDKLMKAVTSYGSLASVVGFQVFMFIQQYSPDSNNPEDHVTNLKQTPHYGDGGGGSVQSLCQLHARYESCVINSGLREICVSWQDMVLHFSWSYLCDPHGGLPDLENSSYCLANNPKIDNSISDQLTRPVCQNADMTFMKLTLREMWDALHGNKTNRKKRARDMWSATRNLSSACFEPPFKEVCGVAGEQVIRGLYAQFGNIIRNRIDPGSGGNHGNKRLDPGSGGGHGNKRVGPGSSGNHDNKDPGSGGNHGRNQEKNATHDGDIYQKKQGFKSLMSGNDTDWITKALIKTERFIRKKFGSCAAADQEFNMIICAWKSISTSSIPFPDISNFEEFLLKMCDSVGMYNFHKCLKPHYISCKKGFMSGLDVNIDATCIASIAVNKEREQGCFLPKPHLGIYGPCNVTMNDMIGLLMLLVHTPDMEKLAALVKVWTKPGICIGKVMKKDMMTRLPTACSTDTREKLNTMYDQGIDIIPAIYPYMKELADEYKKLKPNTTASEVQARGRGIKPGKNGFLNN